MSWLPDQTGGGVSLALALGLVVVSFVPLWAAVLWMATSGTPWRWVAERSPLRWFALASLLAGILLGNFGAGWVKHELLGRARPSDQQVARNLAVALQLLWVLAAGWARKRGRASLGASRDPAKRPLHPPTTRPTLAPFAVWAAVAAAYLLLRFGVQAIAPSATRDWAMFALAAASLVLLVAMQIRFRRSLRASRDGGRPRRS